MAFWEYAVAEGLGWHDCVIARKLCITVADRNFVRSVGRYLERCFGMQLNMCFDKNVDKQFDRFR